MKDISLYSRIVYYTLMALPVGLINYFNINISPQWVSWLIQITWLLIIIGIMTFHYKKINK